MSDSTFARSPPPIPPRPSTGGGPAQLSEIVLDDSSAHFSSQQPGKVPDSTGDVSANTSGNHLENIIEEEKKSTLKTGKVISLVYPSNKHCAWLTPPIYNFEKMPKAFSSKEFNVPHAVYKEFMRTITSDVRFQSYCVLFSRVVPIWIMCSVVMLLLMLLASQNGGLHVMVFTVLWTVMLCLGLGFCIVIRKYLVHALHLVVRDANDISLKHNILVGVQDRGQLSCHKVVLVLMYYDLDDCLTDTKKLIRVNKANQPIKSEMPSEEELEASARELLITNAQPYLKAYAKKQLLFPTKPSEGVSEYRPKHCQSSLCLCLFVEKKVFHTLPILNS